MLKRFWPTTVPSLLSLVIATQALAVPDDYAFTQVPSRFQSQDLTVGSRALGEICHSRDQMPDGTVCNPAYLGDYEDGSLLIRAYVGNGYTAFSTANEMIFQPITREFLQDLFKEKNVISLEAQGGLAFTAKHFSAGFSPYRIQYLSEIHNPNLPVVAVHAALERNLTFGTGTGLGPLTERLKDFKLGARLKIAERKYIHTSFSLLQAVTEDSSTLLPVRTQRAVYLDPSAAWTSSTLPWKISTAVSTKNLGVVTPRDPLYPDRPDLDGGIGLEPQVPIGKLKLGLDYTDILHGEGLMPRMRLGASYRIGIIEAMVGYRTVATTVGVQFGFEIIQAGVVYEFMRSDFEGTETESKVATEISIRF